MEHLMYRKQEDMDPDMYWSSFLGRIDADIDFPTLRASRKQIQLGTTSEIN